ncbi:MAG TPA: APC family permease [Solirubrobacteraceae bacterium]|nr:APC family permease [Solirubrobacteraceae bacterium]
MAQEQAGAQTPAGASQGQLGERRLTAIHAIGQSLAIGPMFSAGLLTGLVASVAGFSSPLSVLLGAIGALCLGYVISIYARRYSGAGAIYEYLVHGAHPSIGVFGAGLYGLGVLFLGGGGVFIANGFLAESFFSTHLQIEVTWWIWGIVALVIAVGLNHLGVRLAIRGVLALAAISVIPFLILAVSIIAQGGDAGNTLSVFGTAHSSTSGVFHGILFAVTLFIGFEAAASIGEEAHDPHRSIPIALIGSVALAGIFYLLVTYAAAIGFGVKGATQAWAADPSPMGTLAQHYVGKGLATTIDLVVLLDSLSVAIAFVVAGSRVFFALARDGLLPSLIGRTTARDTPLGGNLVILVAGVAALLFGGLTHYGDAIKLPNNIEAFSISAAAGSFLIEAVYGVLAIAAFGLIWRTSSGGTRLWRLLVAAVGLATPVLAYYGSLHPFPTYPNNRGIIFAGIAALLVLIWFGYLQIARPERVRAAARHADAHHGVPPLDEPLAHAAADRGGDPVRPAAG